MRFHQCRCRRHGLRADTASAISVDQARSLSKELRDANTVVLRLGTGRGDAGPVRTTALQLAMRV